MIALIKASVVVITLLAFYKLFLEKESFFKANRIYLLSCLAFALVLPFIALPKLSPHQGYVSSILNESGQGERNNVPESSETVLKETIRDKQRPRSEQGHVSESPQVSQEKDIATRKPNALAQQEEPKPWSQVNLWDVIILIYALGAAILAFRLLIQVVRTLKDARKADDKIVDEGIVIINLHGDIAPCSFFKYIFINPEKYDYETYEQILLHERIHVKQQHSIDLLFAELAIIIMWFNPFAWLLRWEIEKNIEYQTDDILVNGSSDVKESYQMNLVKIAGGSKPLVVSTNYNQSLIKQRILKMNNEKSNNRSYWKYTLVAPLIFVLLVFLNKPNIGFAKSNNASQTSSESILSTIPVEDNKGKTDDQVTEKSVATSEEEGTLDSPFANSCKALNEAVRAQDLEGIKSILKKLDPNCVDPDPGYEIIEQNDKYTWRRSYPRTPLANAARIGDLEIGKLLVEAGAKADFDRGDHGSPMTESANNGHLDFLKFMVAEGADLNYMTDGEGTALHCGARNGHLDIVKYALDQGADLDRQNDGQGTPLNGAARNGHLETVAFLIEKGADINKQNDGQGSALNAAARNGHVAVAELLIDKGASINAQRDGQGTALNAAARNGHNKMIELLLSKGADINRQNDGQGSPLNAAAKNGHIETAKVLLNNGANVNLQNDGQGSPLNAAARNGHIEMIELLLDNGADIDLQNDGQGSALNAAARNGHIETVELLLASGASINRQNDGQGSALNAAARNGHLDTVKLLVEKGANVNQRSDGQGTALDAALRNRHRRVADYLKDQGAR